MSASVGYFSSSGSLTPIPGVSPRTVILASPDQQLRSRLNAALVQLRWQVFEAAGAAEAMGKADIVRPEAILIDSWLPDLEVTEFVDLLRLHHPGTDLMHTDGSKLMEEGQSSLRHELLLAVHSSPDTSTPPQGGEATPNGQSGRTHTVSERLPASSKPLDAVPGGEMLSELVGASAAMREMSRLIRLVAPRSTTVLIEGETGSGKELVAKAIHRLSSRSQRPLVVLNCAAIPEALLEAELFGHTRGAFTGATQARVGRIETAEGGTLFLDEIGEMPLSLQAKMLRFLECGELQRVGDNDLVHVDVRVIAATHQDLELRAEANAFRLDLYHRLAVFPIDVPPLRERTEDLPLLVEHFLKQLSQKGSLKLISSAAIEELGRHPWSGNVRELRHVLERAVILSGDCPEIGPGDIRVRRRRRD